MTIYDGHVYSAGKNASGKWVHKARWYPHKGARRKMKNFTSHRKIDSKRAAEAFLDSMRRDEVTNSIAFTDLVKAWRAERVDCCKPGTRAEYDRLLRCYITPVFGNRCDAASITPMDIQSFNQNLIGDGKSSTVRNQVLTILRGIFRYGIRLHLLTKDPTTAIKKPPPQTRDVYILTNPQQQALFSATPEPKYKMLFALAMFTGLRQGELLGLRWSSIDFERGIIVAREQFTNGAWDTPKNGKTRQVPFDNQTSDWLKKWRARCPRGELVFPSDNGSPLDAKNMCNRDWRPALEYSGIKAEVAAAGHPPFRFHDLRHCYASLLLNNGASLYDVKQAMGHASIVTTEKNYAHLVPGFFEKLRERTGEITSGIDLDAKPNLRVVK